MTWQDIAVFIVVAAAVLFLIGRNVNLRRRRGRPAETFVPLTALKKSATAPKSDDTLHCH
jgi:hypothetical protein